MASAKAFGAVQIIAAINPEPQIAACPDAVARLINFPNLDTLAIREE